MNRIVYAGFLLLLGLSCSPATHASDALTRRLLQIQADHGTVGITVAIMRDGEIVRQAGVGLADRGRGLPMTDETKFRIASISKVVTATALMQLWEQGRFQLDDNISPYLGYAVVNPDHPTTPITFRQLLTHTSSVRDGSNYNSFLSATYRDGEDAANIRELIHFNGSSYNNGAQFTADQPGSTYRYSNLGFGILGTLVEKISGERFDVYARKNIFAPLGLTASFEAANLPDINQLGVIYRPTSTGWSAQFDNHRGVVPSPMAGPGYVPGQNALVFGPQGGLRASPGDLLKFAQQFIKPPPDGPRILQESTADLMLQRHWPGRGLGFARRNVVSGELWAGHGGSAHGLLSRMYFRHGGDFGFAIMTNGYNSNPMSSIEQAALAYLNRRILNGVHDFSNTDLTWSHGFDLGFGPEKEGTLHLINARITVDPEITLADSDGSGAGATATVNIDSQSELVFTSGGIAIFGQDGAATVNIAGESAPGGLLATRQVVLGREPGSSGTVNVAGPHAGWNHLIWFVDAGRGGHGEVNVLDGGRIWNAQRFVIGGTYANTVAAGGSGSLTVDGPGSTVDFGNSSLAYLGIGRRGTGQVTVSNGGSIRAVSNSDPAIYVGHWESGSEGTLRIESGGRVSTSGLMRVANSEAGTTGSVTVTGAGSALSIDDSLHVGSAGDGSLHFNDGAAGEIGGLVHVGSEATATGSLELKTATLSIGTSLSVGVDAGAIGAVTLADGSEATVGTFLHTGRHGTGEVAIAGGSSLTVGSPDNGFSAFIGRQLDGDGKLGVRGPGSLLNVINSLYVAADPNRASTGASGLLIVTDEAAVHVGQDMVVRAGGSVELDGGTIVTASGSTSLAGPVSVTGSGMLDGDVSISGGAGISGTGKGIVVTGTLSGAGSVENLALGGAEARASTGALSLSNATFAHAAGATLNLILDDAGDHGPLISFDGSTDFQGTALSVSFETPDPAGRPSYALFSYEGAEDAAYRFAGVTVPDRWFFLEGVLYQLEAFPSHHYLNWADASGLPSGAAAPGADPTGDGFTNLDKFAFGIDPAKPATALVEVARHETALVLQWNRPVAGGIEYVIEHSDTLRPDSWAPLPAQTPVVVEDPATPPPEGYERVEYQIGVPDLSGRFFLRVRAAVDETLLP